MTAQPATGGLLARAHGRVAGLKPAPALLLAMALGALSALAQPPFHLWPLAILALSGLVWLLDGAAARPRPLRAMAARCWAFGFGGFAAGLWWVANAFIARGPDFYPLIPFAVTLLPAGLALFWAAAGALCALYWPQSPRRVLVFAGAVFVTEYLRGHILSGFPWQLAGMVWDAGGPMAQGAAWIGLYGLSLVTLIAFSAPAAAAGLWAGRGARRDWLRLAPMAGGFLMCAVVFAAGMGRLATADPALTDLRVRLVQAAIPQDEKWLAQNSDQIAGRYLELTAWPGLEQVDLVVWPESALPILFPDNYGPTLAALGDMLSGGPALAAGVYRLEPASGEWRNSLAVLEFADGGVNLAALYDKVRLVPFGEYTPGGGLLTALGFRLPNVGGFTPGAAAVTLSTPLAPSFAPLICYEIIFPRFVPRGAQRPEWMLNVSNDAWFGDSAGPRQHFAHARLRAIEEGLPVIRAASGGISGAVDAYGRVRAELAPDTQGVLDTALPVAAAPTFYSRVGDLGALFLLFSMLCVVFGSGVIGRRLVLTRRSA